MKKLIIGIIALFIGIGIFAFQQKPTEYYIAEYNSKDQMKSGIIKSLREGWIIDRQIEDDSFSTFYILYKK